MQMMVRSKGPVACGFIGTTCPSSSSSRPNSSRMSFRASKNSKAENVTSLHRHYQHPVIIWISTSAHLAMSVRIFTGFACKLVSQPHNHSGTQSPKQSLGIKIAQSWSQSDLFQRVLNCRNQLNVWEIFGIEGERIERMIKIRKNFFLTFVW